MSYKPYRPAKSRPRPTGAAFVRSCETRSEGDEYACYCGIRWAKDDSRPECQRK